MSTTAAPSTLSPAQIERRICELDGHIAALRAFDVRTYSDTNRFALVALQARVRDTLERCFGYNTSRYTHFQAAGSLYVAPPPPGFFAKQSDLEVKLREEVSDNVERAIGLLQSARTSMLAELADVEHASTEDKSRMTPLSRRVFVVHGHDEGARETLARFLEKIGFEPIILHEKASQNRTVIEKIEAYHDVGFAVVLLTPDDEGCVKGGQPEARARQNVLLELGYFMGRLGRDKVCALKRGEVEIPSDFAGVVWVSMDAGNGWKQVLGQELEAAGHKVDWNKVMRP